MKQKYLKIHQKNHCVGFKSSTFSNFRTAANLQVDTGFKFANFATLMSANIQEPHEMERIPLHLTRQSTVERQENETRDEKGEEYTLSKSSETPSSNSKEIMLIPR